MENLIPWVGLLCLVSFLISPNVFLHIELFQSMEQRAKLLLLLLLLIPPVCIAFLFNQKFSDYQPTRPAYRLSVHLILISLAYFIVIGWVESQIDSRSIEEDPVNELGKFIMYLCTITLISFSGSECLRFFFSSKEDNDEFESNILDWKNKLEIQQLLAIERHISEELIDRNTIFHEAIKSVEQNNMSFKDYPQIILSAKNFQRIDEIIEKHAENLHEILNKEFAWKASSHDPFIRFYKANFSDNFHERIASEFFDHILEEQALIQTEASVLRLAYYFSKYSNANIDELSKRKMGLIGNFIGQDLMVQSDVSNDFKKKLQIFWLLISSHAEDVTDTNQNVESFFQNTVKNLEEAIRHLYIELEISHVFKTPSHIFYNNSDSPGLDLNFIKGTQRVQLIQLSKEYLHQASLRKALMGQEIELLGKTDYESSKAKLVELLKKVIFGK